MRIVLDTNVVVAAFATRGLCAEIFEVCLTEHTLVTSGCILSEVQEKLLTKLHLPHKTTGDILEYLRSSSELCEIKSVDISVCRDKDDDKIIGTALDGNAEFIITGDNDLLILRKYEGIKIVTPREYWNILRRQTGRGK
jgi:putative PIN family toxin of toxin-antitoxin system